MLYFSRSKYFKTIQDKGFKCWIFKDKVPVSIFQFVRSKYFKALSDNRFEFFKSEEKLQVKGSNKPINTISIDRARQN